MTETIATDVALTANSMALLVLALSFLGVVFGLIYVSLRLIKTIRDPKNIPDGPPEGSRAWNEKREQLAQGDNK